MKFTKKCDSTQHKISIRNRRRSSAGMFYTSSAGAVTSLILMLALPFIFGLTGATNLLGLGGSASAADNISLTVDTNNLTINMAPMSSSGDFAKSSNMNIGVSTTSTSGYTLSIASSTGSTDLTNQSDNTKKINSLSSAISESDFSSSSNTQYNNKWGYKPSNLYNSSTEQIITNTDFRPLPGTTGEIIAKTQCANGTSPCTNPTDTYTLSIGTRANNQTKPGNYTNNTFVIMATSNTPPKIYMQGMTADLCLAEPTLVYDSRDEAEYEVAMLRDGSCWMIENLRLGADGSQVTLTSEDSDVVNQFQFTSSADWSNTFTSANVDTAQAYYSGNINLGSYYNWYTATAGTGNSSTAADVEASGSICPKGWVLPNRAEYSNLVVNYNANKDNLLSPETPGYTIGGYYRDAEHRQSTTHTYAWERTAKSATSGDNFFINNGTGAVGSTDGMNKYYGMPMRCRLGGNVSSFTVSFNANGGTGTMSSQSTTSGTLTLNPNAFTRSGYKFAGWSTDPNATEPTYQDGGTIVSYTSVLNLYAVWYKLYAITFTMDSNVTKIDVLDASGATVGTITSSGQSLALAPGDTYTIKPTHATGYTTNTITKTSGAGTLNDKQFAVGAGSATLNVTSKVFPPVHDLVASAWQNEGSRVMTNDKNTSTGIRATITTSNSGVFKYDPSTFGTSSDASNDYDIYFYRGILDKTTGSYGSNGDNEAHPNTVILDANNNGKDTTDTCWRIVRTTGSGGVKLIYQGKWTGSTCANATTNAQVTTSAFNTASNINYQSIIAVGYTFNASYKTTTSSTAYSTLFGSNSSYSGNSTASTMKTYIENTWFTNINSFASKLEPSAGWCNDRTIRSSSSSTSVISDSTSISTPYTTASSGITAYYFGSYVRTRTSSDKPSLTCPRSGADLYTTSSASNGNKQLSKPAALLTADEAAFAGSGYSSSTVPYHAKSYLRSGSAFWLLSPAFRYSTGVAYGYNLDSNGPLYSGYYVNLTYGVRPSISLKPGTTPVSGTGTAADPWIVNP